MKTMIQILPNLNSWLYKACAILLMIVMLHTCNTDPVPAQNVMHYNLELTASNNDTKSIVLSNTYSRNIIENKDFSIHSQNIHGSNILNKNSAINIMLSNGKGNSSSINNNNDPTKGTVSLAIVAFAGVTTIGYLTGSDEGKKHGRSGYIGLMTICTLGLITVQIAL